MNVFRAVAKWIRGRILAAQWRARNDTPPVSIAARRCIAAHRQRVDAAIARNRLDHQNASEVRKVSDDLVEAYLRGKIASIEDVTLWTLDKANKLGCAQQMRERQKAAAPGGSGPTWAGA